MPERSKLVKKIEITLVILAFIGGAVGLIREAASPSVEEQIQVAVAMVLEKRTVPLEEYQVVCEEKGKVEEKLMRALRRIAELNRQGVKDAEGIIEKLRKNGDVSRLLEVLVKDRDTHRNQLIERNQEIAVVAYLKGDIEKATKAVEEILKLKPDDLFGLHQKGHIHILRGELDEAEDCYKRLKELGIEVNDNRIQVTALGNLGVVYQMRGDLDKAEEMYYKVLKIEKKLRRPDSIANLYGNLGVIYWERGELDKAEEMHKKALEIDKKIGMLESQAIRYSNLEMVYEERGEIEKAREYWEKALELYKKIGMQHKVEEVEEWMRKLKGKN